MAENEITDSKGWLSRAKATAKRAFGAEASQPVPMNDLGYGAYDGVSVSMMLGSGKRPARSRAAIYQKLHYMSGDPLCAGALRLNVTMALGGHETTGDVVFIEPIPEVEKDAARLKIVKELQRDLTIMFNQIAPQVAFNGAAFGDGYARPYLEDRVGLVGLYTDELVHPTLVQPYEKGSKTVGYVVSTGEKFMERLTIKQLVRMKMPRMAYTSQMRVIEKAAKLQLIEDDIENLPILPSLIGGSLLESAEEAFDNFQAALAGLVGQRILSSIDESMLSVNLDGMTVDQRKELMGSIKSMLKASKDRAETAIKTNTPVTQRLFHLFPTFGDKQVAQISQFQGTGGSQSYSVDDVMFHAKMLTGQMGIDLSMLGFADILTGGLGEGGFFRTSAQAAERSRLIRVGLSQFFDDLVDLHTLHKYGWVFDKHDRPYKINFYGSISALENENMASKERAANSTMVLVQTLDMMKNMGLPEDTNKLILSKHMKVEDEMANEIAKGLSKAKKDADAKEAAQNGGGFGGGDGGFGGAPGGEDKPKDFDQPQAGLNADDEEA